MSDSTGNLVWPRGGGTAARRGGQPAGSAWAVYPLFSRLDRVLLSSMSRQQQEAVGQHDHGRVVVEAPPEAPLVVVQPQFLLHLLVTLFDLPAMLPSK